mmetsp:Transcript_26625/g.42622  ORF Transcript_26625/g.42622 Transcript_26625/m.42622 type:complete len:225 (+) Transcript_26625:257-931(+)
MSLSKSTSCSSTATICVKIWLVAPRYRAIDISHTTRPAAGKDTDLILAALKSLWPKYGARSSAVSPFIESGGIVWRRWWKSGSDIISIANANESRYVRESCISTGRILRRRSKSKVSSTNLTICGWLFWLPRYAISSDVIALIAACASSNRGLADSRSSSKVERACRKSCARSESVFFDSLTSPFLRSACIVLMLILFNNSAVDACASCSVCSRLKSSFFMSDT